MLKNSINVLDYCLENNIFIEHALQLQIVFIIYLIAFQFKEQIYYKVWKKLLCILVRII